MSRKIFLLIISQGISLFGTTIVGYAIIWYITIKTSSSTMLMLSVLCTYIPQIVISFFVGFWLDRYKKKSLIIAGDSITAMATFIVFLLFYYEIENLSIIFIACALRSIGAGMQTPSQNAILPSICSANELQKINSINATISSIMTILSPSLGGFLISTLGFTFTLTVDVATAILAILVISFLKLDFNIKCSDILYCQDFIRGVKYMFNQKTIMNLVVFLSLFYFFLSAPSYLSPILVERNYGGDIWKIAANQISWAVGTLVGGIFIIVKNKFNQEYLVIGGCTLCLGITICLWGYIKDFYIYLILMGGLDCFFQLYQQRQLR